MSVIATALRHMMDAGMDRGAILAAVADMEEVLKALTTNDQPSKGALRQRRYEQKKRQKASESVTNDGNDAKPSDTDAQSAPPNEYISNPPEKPLSAKADPSLSSQIEIVVSEWNGMAARTGCTAVRPPLTGKRLAGIKARLAEHGLDSAKQAIAAVARSPFCRGEVKDWRADFKFFVVPDNFVKLLEGGDDRSARPGDSLWI